MMVVYKYEAVDSYGKLIKGYLAANSLEMVCAQLKKKSLRVLQVKKALFRTVFFLKKVSSVDLVLWAKSVTQLLKVGMNLSTVMQTVAEKAGALSAVTNEINNELNQGSSFSQAASKFKYIFGNLFVGLIAVAEHTGGLISAFEYITAHYEFKDKITRQIRGALYYPILLSVIVLPISLFFVFYLVPIFANMIEECGGELSWLTRGLCAFASFFSNYWLYVLVLALGGWFALMLYKTQNKDKFANLLLKLPIVGKLMHQFYLTLFFHVFGEMIKSGMNVVKALEVGGSMVKGKYILELKRVKDKVILGQKLSQAMENQSFFTDIAIKMISIGEQTGELDKVSVQIGQLYQTNLEDSLSKVQQTITPVFMAALGGLFLLIVLGGALPLYNVISVMH